MYSLFIHKVVWELGIVTYGDISLKGRSMKTYFPIGDGETRLEIPFYGLSFEYFKRKNIV